MNQVVLVGRLVRDPKLYEGKGGSHFTGITLAVPRSFKNMEGSYDTDFIDCILWEHIAKNTVTYCHKGNIVGIKGRLQSRKIEKENAPKETVLEVIAEKVTFLSSKEKEISNV